MYDALKCFSNKVIMQGIIWSMTIFSAKKKNNMVRVLSITFSSFGSYFNVVTYLTFFSLFQIGVLKGISSLVPLTGNVLHKMNAKQVKSANTFLATKCMWWHIIRNIYFPALTKRTTTYRNVTCCSENNCNSGPQMAPASHRIPAFITLATILSVHLS